MFCRTLPTPPCFWHSATWYHCLSSPSSLSRFRWICQRADQKLSIKEFVNPVAYFQNWFWFASVLLFDFRRDSVRIPQISFLTLWGIKVQIINNTLSSGKMKVLPRIIVRSLHFVAFLLANTDARAFVRAWGRRCPSLHTSEAIRY